MLQLAFLSSHNGSNTMAVIEACQNGRLEARPGLVISNNSHAGVLQTARQRGVPHVVFNGLTHPDPRSLDSAICDELVQHDVDLVLLLGYMKLLGPRTVHRFRRRILNIHPGLLPDYGGKGMYGMRVHQAVLEAGETHTGITIHHANEHYDEGDIVAQCTVPILPQDTPETLAQRVLIREHSFLVETLRSIIAGIILLE